MSIEESRDLLGNEIAHLSDAEVQKMIDRDRQMVRSFIQVFERDLTLQKRKGDNGRSD